MRRRCALLGAATAASWWPSANNPGSFTRPRGREAKVACALFRSGPRVRGIDAAGFVSTLELALGDEVHGPAFLLRQDLADILADNADHDQLHTAQHHQSDHQRRIAGHRLAE